MRAASVVLSCATLAACGGDTLWIELPPLLDARALVLVLDHGGTIELVGLELEAGRTTEVIRVEAVEDAAIDALLYPAPLAELRIPAGRTSAEQPAGRLLPAPARSFFTAVRGGQGSGWTETGGPSTRARGARFVPTVGGGCAEFDVEVLELDTEADNTFAIAIDDETALLGTEDGAVFRLSRGGVLERVSVIPPVELFGAARGWLGDLWFGGNDGVLYRGELGATLRLSRVAPSPEPQLLHWLDLGMTDDGLELYSLSIEGHLQRFRLGEWVSLAKFPPGVPGDHAGGVVRLGPGAAIAVWPKVADAVFVSGDTTRTEATPLLGGFGALANIPGLGVVGGATEGGFVRWDGVSWSELPGSPFSFAVNAIVPYEDGFLYGGPVGNFGQFSPSLASRGAPGEAGFCPLSQPAPHWIRHIVLLGEDVLLAGTNDTYPETPITILRRR